jgi:hypothetical protein
MLLACSADNRTAIDDWINPRLKWLDVQRGLLTEEDHWSFSGKGWNRIGDRNGDIWNYDRKGFSCSRKENKVSVGAIRTILDIKDSTFTVTYSDGGPSSVLPLQQVLWNHNEWYSYQMLYYGGFNNSYFGEFIATINIHDDAVAVMMKLAGV